MKKIISIATIVTIFFFPLSNANAIENLKNIEGLNTSSTLENESMQEIMDQGMIEAQYILMMEKILKEELGDDFDFSEYGTIHVERNNGFQIVIGFKEESDIISKIRNKLNKELGNKIAFKQVEYTTSELEQFASEVTNNWDQIEAAGVESSSVGIKPSEGKISLKFKDVLDLSEISSLTSEESIVEDSVVLESVVEDVITPYLDSSVPDGILDVQYTPDRENSFEFSRKDNHTTLGGGIALKTSKGGTCTVGFLATKGTEKFIGTAGHCVDTGSGTVQQYTKTVGVNHVTYLATRNYDIGLVRITDSTRKISNLILKQGTTNYDAKITATGSAYEGLNVCKAGATTNYTCGSIGEVNTQYKDTDTGQVIKGVFHVDSGNPNVNYSSPGDSGSPVWYGNILVGVHSGGGDTGMWSWGYATPTSTIKDYFGTDFQIHLSSVLK